MRILHIFDHSVPLQSGYVSRSLAILRNQHARGWQTVQLTSPRHGASAGTNDASETIEGLTFHRTQSGITLTPVLRELTEMYALRTRIAELVRTERPDILHAHSPVLNAIPAISIGKKLGVPVVYEVRAFWEDAAVDHGRAHEGGLRYAVSRWLDTRSFRRADQIVALCEPLRRDIIDRGIAAERVSVVPNAVDASFFVPSDGNNQKLRESLGLANRVVLGFVGSFYKYEGLDLLLDAVTMMLEDVNNIAVLLVGGGPEEARLRSIVQARGLDEIVKFVGRVKIEEVVRYYQAVDIFVFPRRRMRLTELVTPLKPLEAMAQMRPVVASDVGGHRELIRHSDTGYLFPPDSPTVLAACLRSVVGDPVDRDRIIRNARQFVETERSWDSVVARYTPIYEQLLSRSRGSDGPDG